MTTQKKITLFVYMTAALILSFLLGRMFGTLQKMEEADNEIPRVYIEQQKTQLKIETSDPNIEIYVDGERIETTINN